MYRCMRCTRHECTKSSLGSEFNAPRVHTDFHTIRCNQSTAVTLDHCVRIIFVYLHNTIDTHHAQATAHHDIMYQCGKTEKGCSVRGM